MNANSYLSSALLITGIFCILIAIVAAYSAFTSFFERQSHGSGMLFADVELLDLVTIIFVVLGLIMIFTARKILKLGSAEKK